MFILVYRLAIDAKTRKCDGVAGRKYPSLLEGFTDGHIINGSYETSASTARGLLCFCLMALTGPVSVQSVQSVVEKLLKVSRLF